jgi:hypothetical protein
MHIIETAKLIVENSAQRSFRFSPVIPRAPHLGCQKIDDIFVHFPEFSGKDEFCCKGGKILTCQTQNAQDKKTLTSLWNSTADSWSRNVT